MFNSALIYEFSVLKSYVEPLLYGIPQDAPEYQEAKRLLKFFDYILSGGQHGGTAELSAEGIYRRKLLRIRL